MRRCASRLLLALVLTAAAPAAAAPPPDGTCPSRSAAAGAAPEVDSAGLLVEPGAIVAALQSVSFANVEDVGVVNLTTQESAPDVRLNPDGSFQAFVPVREGRNRILVNALASDGSEANLEIVNAFRQVRGLSTVTLDQLAKRSPYFAVDLRLTKIVKLGGPRSLELMAEVFNLFNRTNFSNPNGTLTSATFLDVSSSSDGREAQLGVRFRF